LIKIIISGAICILSSGCASMQMPYMNSGAPGWMFGGYSEQKLAEYEYIVSYEGNVYTTRETIVKHLNKRASELCGENNYLIGSSTSGGDSHLVNAGASVMSISSSIDSIHITCKSPKSNYLSTKLGYKEGATCSIPIYNATRRFSYGFLVEIHINDIYITALPYKGYILAPVQKGNNKISVGKPYSSELLESKFQVETCKEQIMVSHSSFGKFIVEPQESGLDPLDKGYKLNIE